MLDKPVAILYEHPEWFKPLFSELERRRVPYRRLYVGDVHNDPSVRECPYSLVINRVSAYPSGGCHPGSVEYLLNDADGQVYYCDVNPLSNFVADAPAVVGFDPVVKFVD